MQLQKQRIADDKDGAHGHQPPCTIHRQETKIVSLTKLNELILGKAPSSPDQHLPESDGVMAKSN